MKSRLTSSAAAGFIALAAFATSCSNDQKTSGTTPATPGSAKAANESIVYINSDSLVANYTYYKEVKATMEEKSKKAQADLTSKGDAFQREVNQYNQSAQGMSADVRAATEERLKRKQIELQTLNQNASSALANESSAENEKIYNKVAAYLKTFAKEKGYKYVMSYSRSVPTIMYADESLDVTKEVLKGLNEEYKKK